MQITCPYCGAPAEATRNPFQGAGLAVHSSLLKCSGCDRVVLDVDPRQLQPQPPRRGLWARMRASIRRFFA
ncbi:hypothetical protein [Leifsonia sp. Root112D2]|uniref:hypothetical protein n=1 Tax=Leifsonia sp. Root112D2 TaxID=1736426 RepID=UPI000AD5A122|nr:hypothetical protein [Leifsonia sp. Root112D2]